MIPQLTASSLRWVIRRTGAAPLLSISLLFVLFLAVGSGLSREIKGLGLLFLMPIISLGLLVGWLLARTRLRMSLAAPVAVVSGAILVFIFAGSLGKPLWLVSTSFFSLIGRDWIWRVDWSPVWAAFTDLGHAVQIFNLRVGNWLWAALKGQPILDSKVSAMLWGLSLWIAANLASWITRRRKKPLLAVVPGITLLAGVLNYTHGDILPLLISIASALFLIILIDYTEREASWEHSGIDYSYELRLDLGFTVTLLVAGLIALAWIVPSIRVQQIVKFAQELLNPTGETGRPLAESLGLEPGVGDSPGLGGQLTSGLPRRHLIGSGSELDEQVIMTIKTGELPPMEQFEADEYPIPRYYWRAITYDQYNGAGWNTSRTRSVDYQPNEPSLAETPLFHRLVRQKVERRRGSGTFLYAAGTLLTADQAYRIDWRSTTAPDIFGAEIQADGYQAESLLPEVEETELRSTAGDYPDWIREHYLELPASLPERVRALALNITAGSPTQYDRAQAIETYLRTFPYTLDLPSPPADRDIVDYFLFDLKKGYCDYYASAMVVLARAVGLPSRLVVGYASGQYDSLEADYVITAADAHSWAEIYFPSYGWIEFEPTAGQPPVVRSQSSQDHPPAGLTDVRPDAPAPEIGAILRGWPNWAIWVSAVLLLSVLACSAWYFTDIWRIQRLSPEHAISSLYTGFRRAASQLPIIFHLGDTPYEFVGLLDNYLKHVDGNKQLQPTLKSISNEAYLLTEIFNRSAYSPRNPGKKDQAQAIQSWRRLRWRLWLARLLYH